MPTAPSRSVLRPRVALRDPDTRCSAGVLGRGCRSLVGSTPKLTPFCLPGSYFWWQDVVPSPRVPGEVGAQWGLWGHRGTHRGTHFCTWGGHMHIHRAVCTCMHTQMCACMHSCAHRYVCTHALADAHA